MIKQRLVSLICDVLNDASGGDIRGIATGWAEVGMSRLFEDGVFKPVGGQILVKDIPKGDVVTEGGIYLPGSKTEDELQRAVVVETSEVPVMKQGKVYTYRPAVVAKGDVVLYEKFKGVEVRRGLDTYVLIEEKDIVGLLEDDEGA